MSDNATQAANRLAHSASAYLRSAAHQPIDWYEFGEEAFQRAKELDRLILLDIGAVWCHWCHVIDRESYENPEIAALINQFYVPVKVDRDQRPDVDSRYQKVISAMTGHAGWPLTGFLTHDGRVLYGGTYFPPQSMMNLLQQLHQLYQEKKTEIWAQQPVLETAPEAASDDPIQDETLALSFSQAAYEPIVTGILSRFDPEHGGFGTHPKFPHFSALAFLAAQLATLSPTSPEREQGLNILNQTLVAMAEGGVYDQLAGGFHRYSVDARWHVPHFEKMLYDNAEALSVYSQAFALTGNPLFKQIATDTFAWMHRELADTQAGGFYASQDADIDLDDDGDHFTWSLTDLRDLLTPQEEALVVAYYDITPVGDMHERPGRNVLWVKKSLPALAKQFGVSDVELQDLLQSAQGKMRDARSKRPIPFIDQTLYTNWNAMALCGVFDAADLLDLPEARAFAQKTIDRLLTEYYQPKQQVLHCTGVPGFLDDYAQLALACIKASESLGEPHYLTVAGELLALLEAQFEDRLSGGFFDTVQKPDALALLKARHKPVEDSPSSSAIAVALQAMVRFARLTPDTVLQTHYLQRVNWHLCQLFPKYGNYGLFVSSLGLAAIQWLQQPIHCAVSPNQNNLLKPLRSVFHPAKGIVMDAAVPEAAVVICHGTHCLPPVFTEAELHAQFNEILRA